MKRLFAAAAGLVLVAGSAMADPVHGTWKSQPGESGGYIHVKISACGSSICGKITKVVGNDNTSIVGRSIIKGMKAKGNGSYSGGTIWAPDTDKTFKSKMSLSGNRLKVSGCVAGGLICRSQTWSRL